MTIGEKLKKLRTERNMTQTEVAKSLGVTSQAVSKWENENGLPDITQLVPLADLFGVSIDVLFDHSQDEREKEIAHILDLARYELRDNNQWEEMIDLLRHGLRKYPDDYRLMEMLCNALYFYPKQCGFDCTPEAEKCAYECIDYAERILGGCTDNQLRYNAVRWLVYQHRWLHNDYQIQQIAKTMPPMELSSDGLMTLVDDRNLSYRSSMKFVHTCLENIHSILIYEMELEKSEFLSAQEKIDICCMMITVIQSYFCNHDMNGLWYSSLMKYLYYAAMYSAEVNEMEDTLNYLEKILETGEEWLDKSKEVSTLYHYTSPLTRELEGYTLFHKYGYSQETIYSVKLNHHAFDKLRDHQKFQDILVCLRDIESKAHELNERQI